MTHAYTYFADLNSQLPEIPSDSILSRTLYSDEQVKVILFSFANGQELSEHTSSKPAIIHIVNGEAQVRLGEDEYEAAAGMWAHLPPNLPHSILAKTPVTMLLMLLEQAG